MLASWWQLPESSRWLQVCWNSVVEEAFGNEKGLLGGVKLKDVKTGELKDVQVCVPPCRRPIEQGREGGFREEQTLGTMACYR